MATRDVAGCRRPFGRLWLRTSGTSIAVRITASIALVGLLSAGCHSSGAPETSSAERPAGVEARPEASRQTPEQSEREPGFPLQDGEEISLFDGQTLGQWKVTDFGGQGDVSIKDGAIYLEMGSYTTGITWSGPVVRMD